MPLNAKIKGIAVNKTFKKVSGQEIPNVSILTLIRLVRIIAYRAGAAAQLKKYPKAT
ncbi:hypothetical protein ANSO36C_07760 [Nostoc cf. commune SO-36]|uniref:Uncharacterized protein n=1 Tax=Nostoc cf. commune SO-36 TaxID=449208 RepID=A0ABM7YWF4_NOSCO|nr:hypothetical protein ANSO36C_07760 [Nostoc cf. commune SO-36]